MVQDRRIKLLDFAFCASGFESFLVLFGFDWGDLFFDWGWDGVDELLGIHEAETSDGLDGFDDGDFGTRAKAFENEADFGWAFVDWSFFFNDGWASGGDGSGDAEGLFDEFDEVVELKDGVFLQGFNDFFFC
jgi:hypothetical protein